MKYKSQFCFVETHRGFIQKRYATDIDDGSILYIDIKYAIMERSTK